MQCVLSSIDHCMGKNSIHWGICTGTKAFFLHTYFALIYSSQCIGTQHMQLLVNIFFYEGELTQAGVTGLSSHCAFQGSSSGRQEWERGASESYAHISPFLPWILCCITSFVSWLDLIPISHLNRDKFGFGLKKNFMWVIVVSPRKSDVCQMLTVS